jgi:transposase
VRSVERILKSFSQNKAFDLKIHNCGRKSVISIEQEAKIVAEIKETPDITLLELIEKFELKITESGLSKWCIKHGYSFKKRLFIQQNKTVRTFRKNAANLSKI